MTSRYRNTILLSGLFIILLFLTFSFDSGGGMRKKSLFFTLPRDSSEISFITSTQTVTLKKDDLGSFQVFGADKNSPVDEEMIDALREQIMGFQPDLRVSKNPENWSKYGLDETSAQIMSLTDGARTVRLYFGIPGNQPGSTHVRIDELPEVYLVSSSLPQFISYDLTKWRKKQLIPIDPLVVTSFDVVVDDQSWAFEKRDEAWTYRGPSGDETLTDARADGFQDYFNALFTLKADGFAPLSELTSPSIRLVFRTGEGLMKELAIQLDGEGPSARAFFTEAEEIFTLGSDLRARITPRFLENQPENS